MSRTLGGEFIITDKATGVEHCIPNQFTVIGMQQVLAAAFQGAELTWYMGVCAINPADSLALNAINEPTEGVNGYARVELVLNSTNWPIISNINGESYVESRDADFIASGTYDMQVNRFFLTDGTYVIAISSPMEEGLHTVDESFSTKYRLWFR